MEVSIKILSKVTAVNNFFKKMTNDRYTENKLKCLKFTVEYYFK